MLRRYTDYQFKICNFAPTGVGWPKISNTRFRPHQPFFLQKTKLNVLSYGIKSALIFLSFRHNPRVWQTDGWTDRERDRQTEFASLDCICIPCAAVKIGQKWTWPRSRDLLVKFWTPYYLWNSWRLKPQNLHVDWPYGMLNQKINKKVGYRRQTMLQRGQTLAKIGL